MSKEITRGGSGLFAAAATAVSAIGISMVPVSMLPVAQAACDDWVLGPTTLALLQDAPGTDVDIYGWSGKQITALPSGKPAYAIMWTPGGKTTGTVAGNITGKTVNVNVNWIDGPGKGTSSTFVGDIGDDGIVRGAGFHSKFAAKCNTAPAQNPGGGAATPAKATVTVQQNSDVYDAAGGGGNRLGPATYFLKPGRTLELVAPCSDDWCNLVIPDPEVPGGKGFVYSGIDSGQNFLKLNQ